MPSRLKKMECMWNDWNFCYGLIITTPSELCLPHEMGRHIVFSSVVCLSVRPSRFHVSSISFKPLMGFTNNFAQMSSMMRRCAWLRLNIVWLYLVSALYYLNPWWVLQITLHKCQVWWDDVQCLCLTKVGSSQIGIVLSFNSSLTILGT